MVVNGCFECSVATIFVQLILFETVQLQSCPTTRGIAQTYFKVGSWDYIFMPVEIVSEETP